MYIHDILGIPKERKPPYIPLRILFILQERLRVIHQIFCDALSHDEMHIFHFFNIIMRLVRVILFCQNLITPFLYHLMHLFYIVVHIDIHSIYNCLWKQKFISDWRIIVYASNNVLHYHQFHISYLIVILIWFTDTYMMWHWIHSTVYVVYFLFVLLSKGNWYIKSKNLVLIGVRSLTFGKLKWSWEVTRAT